MTQTDQSNRPKYGPKFESAILKLCIQDPSFGAKFVHYMREDIDSKDFIIFTNKFSSFFFECLVDSVKTYKTTPSLAQLEQRIHDDQDDVELYQRALKTIMDTDISDEEFYRKWVGNYIKQLKQKKLIEVTIKSMQQDPQRAPEIINEIVGEINNVSFDQDNTLSLKDYDSVLQKTLDSDSRCISTGCTELDDLLGGGYPRQALVAILAVVNSGKSLFCISSGANALRAMTTDAEGNPINQGLKVLHVHLEGNENEALFRYLSNLSGVSKKKIVSGEMTTSERARVDKARTTYDDRLMIRNMLSFGMSIERMYATLKEDYKKFKFDLVVVDYGRLLTSEAAQNKTERFVLEDVHQKLAAIASEFNCTVLTPVQANREAISKIYDESTSKKKEFVLRSDKIGESYAISHVAEVVLSMNITDSERDEGKMRLFLEKQRNDIKGVTFGFKTDYDTCNLITGETYDPKVDIEEMSTSVKSKQEQGSNKQSKSSGFNPDRANFTLVPGGKK